MAQDARAVCQDALRGKMQDDCLAIMLAEFHEIGDGRPGSLPAVHGRGPRGGPMVCVDVCEGGPDKSIVLTVTCRHYEKSVFHPKAYG